MTQGGTVLIVGSAPHATLCQSWDRSAISDIVAINNAWRVRPDWDYLVYPDDFPQDRKPDPLDAGQVLIGSEAFVPAQNQFGGFVYAGGTMAFTAGYWALAALRPSRMIFVGCDMIYPRSGRTHFYGAGQADPLRPDPSLRSLEAKSARLMLCAAELGCACLRAPDRESRLLFPAISKPAEKGQSLGRDDLASDQIDAARTLEQQLGYFVPSGRYWEVSDQYSEAQIDRLDQMWLDALAASDIGELPSAVAARP